MLKMDHDLVAEQAYTLRDLSIELAGKRASIQTVLRSVGRQSSATANLATPVEAIEDRARDLIERVTAVELFSLERLRITWEFPHTTARVEEATTQISDALNDDFWDDVTVGDLNKIREVFDGLLPTEIDRVIDGLTDDQLEKFFGEWSDDSWLDDGWDRSAQWEFLHIIGSQASLDTWRRLGQFTELIDPDPTTAMSDSARDDPTSVERFESYFYKRVEGDLFATGSGDSHALDLTDLDQGGIGDCYLITAQMALAHAFPDDLQALLHENPNGTFTVTFADGTKVVVSPDFVINPEHNRLAFARSPVDADTQGNELWPLVIEKAYAQYHGGWGDIVGGWPAEAIDELIGADIEHPDPDDITFDQLSDWQADGKLITVGSLFLDTDERDEWPDLYKDKDLAPGHAYLVTEIDDTNEMITLSNPWNPDETLIVLPFDDFTVSVSKVEISTLTLDQ